MLNTSTLNERTYINYYYPELRKIALKNWDEPHILLGIKIELQLRHKKKPVLHLINQIERRLGEFDLERFNWVSTEAEIGCGNLHIVDWTQAGLLSAVGYKTGRNGLNEKLRRIILDSIYLKEIPKNLKLTNLEDWGKSKTGKRLKKLADCLASFTRNEKRNYTGDYSISIFERETDLQYLKKKFYNGKYNFGFPDTEV